MQHSIRTFEKDHSFNISTKIISLSEQQVKIVIDGKPNMINAIGLVLEETIFHPQGGGQPSDKGSIDGSSVLTVREDKTQLNENGSPTIFHFFDTSVIDCSQFKIGNIVELKVDESYRLQCMRSHSTGHLIADVLELNPKFSAYQAKASHGNHFPGSEYIKVILNDQPENLENFCEEINSGLNELIQQDLAVSIVSKSSEARHIQIGSSKRMCGGTHLKSSRDAEGCKTTKIRCSKNKDGQIEATIFYSC